MADTTYSCGFALYGPPAICTCGTCKPSAVEITFSQKMIEDVFNEFEKENPGKTHQDIGKDEFSSRLMKKITASARVVEGGNA